MSHTLSRTAEPVSERDAAWFEELAATVARARAGALAPFDAPDQSAGATAWALIGLVDAGQSADSPECERAARRLRQARPLGARETAAVLVALRRSGHAIRAACAETVHDGLNRLLERQNRDGGWGVSAGDEADEPSCPAVTANVLEALGHYGFRAGQPPVGAAVRFVLAHQDESGAWGDRGDGIAASSSVLAGLQVIGFDMNALVVCRAVRWLKEAQNDDGGWGATDSDPASTARALLGLLAASEADGAEVRAGAELLVGTQNADGGWGAGAHFPLAALARYCAANGYPPAARGANRKRVDPGARSAGAPGPAPRRVTDRGSNVIIAA